MHCQTREVAGGVPIKLWTGGLPIEESALEQLEQTARLPIAFRHLAVMPDVHYGRGATIGSVIATKEAIIPAAVGVDIGCGMQAARTTLTAGEIHSELASIRQQMEKSIPHGRTHGGSGRDRGAWGRLSPPVEQGWRESGLADRFEELTGRDQELYTPNNARHLGTLGTGNHFLEVCADEEERVWILLHSGSRGPGARIASVFIARATKAAQEANWDLPHTDLAYLEESSPHFTDYIRAMLWAQDFARVNRELMMNAALQTLESCRAHRVDFRQDCHHNFASLERHFDQEVWVTRKGATRARGDEWGIIPGSMGTGSHIVRGRGNADSFTSCSHGAGRAMSRTVARKTITIAQHIAAMKGIECRTDKGVIDESPAAYKDLSEVMRAQVELVEPIYKLRQLLNVKG